MLGMVDTGSARYTWGYSLWCLREPYGTVGNNVRNRSASYNICFCQGAGGVVLSKLKTSEEVTAILEERGIRMAINGCGCCGSPNVSVEIDGDLVVDDENTWIIDMFEEKA